MKFSIVTTCVAVAMLSICQPSAYADTHEYQYPLRFSSGSFVPNERQFSPLIDASGKPIRTAIVQFYKMPTADTLIAQGMQPLYYIPDNAVIAQLPENFEPGDDANIRWVGNLQKHHKLSALAAQAVSRNSAQRQHYMVYFFSNSDNQTIDAAIQARAAVQLNVQGLPHHVRVVDLSDGQLDELAGHPEVLSIMPAPSQLLRNAPAGFCPGPLTVYGPMPNFVAQTNGWDGPGLGAAQITYHFENDTPDIPGTLEFQEIRDALNEWTLHADIAFTEVAQENQFRSLDILFGQIDHGDGFPFQGELAHAFFDTQINPEPIAGDIHFNETFNWAIGAQFDVFTVALHEAGHSLGLNHTDVAGSVMLPVYGGVVTELAPDDIAGIQSIYAAAPNLEDFDGDGIPDNLDNCIERENAAQRDTDGDGYGNQCDADFNGDLIVNFLDLGYMRSVFFTTDPDADLSGDGNVNFLDLAIFKVLFLLPPGPAAMPLPVPATPNLSINADQVVGDLALDFDGNYDVSWTSSAGAATYNLHRYREVPTIDNLTEFNGLTNTFKVENNIPDSLWEYRVQACNADGVCSGFSPGKIVQVGIQ